MGLPKGRTNNPAGKPKGTKNKFRKPIVDEIIEVAKQLEAEGIGLAACAKQDPAWFFTHIFKNIIPKNIEVEHDGELTIKWQS